MPVTGANRTASVDAACANAPVAFFITFHIVRMNNPVPRTLSAIERPEKRGTELATLGIAEVWTPGPWTRTGVEKYLTVPRESVGLMS